LECRPIAFWDGLKSTRRRRSRFKSTWRATDQQLRFELRHLGVRRAILENDVPEQWIRLDGWIRSDAAPKSPAVAVTFVHEKFGPQRYPCDAFDK
jgi:hypothetical protein